MIRIKGVDTLHGTSYAVVPDMIEAGTYMFAAAATKGDVLIKNVIPKHLEATTAKLEEIGCDVEEFDDSIRVSASKRLGRTHVKTQPYPGYPTDMQPQIAVTLALANGTSIVTESIFENRFKYADELARMGACIKVEGNTAIIDGVEKFTGAEVSAPDLRAGAALVIAGLAAEGVTASMVCLKRISNNPYQVEYTYSAIKDIANEAKSVPRDWINDAGNDVKPELIEYLKPLIQGETAVAYKNGLPDYMDVSHLHKCN